METGWKWLHVWIMLNKTGIDYFFFVDVVKLELTLTSNISLSLLTSLLSIYIFFSDKTAHFSSHSVFHLHYLFVVVNIVFPVSRKYKHIFHFTRFPILMCFSRPLSRWKDDKQFFFSSESWFLILNCLLFPRQCFFFKDKILTRKGSRRQNSRFNFVCESSFQVS